MELLPHMAARARRRLAFYFAIFSILFIIAGSSISVAAQGRWEVTHMKGTQKRRNLDIDNKCIQPHHYRLTYNIPYIRFEEPTDNILIAGKNMRRLLLVLDATGLTTGVHKEKLVLECLDCKTERKCDPRLEIAAEITIIEFDATVDLVSQFRGILDEKLAAAGAVIEKNAREKVDGIIKKGASVITDGGLKDKIKEARANFEKLVAEMISRAEIKKKKPGGGPAAYFMFGGDDEKVVTTKSVTAALDTLCPLFPFCN